MQPVPEKFLSGNYHLGEMPSGALLLNFNALYPWFIIVPHGDFIEWTDLPEDLQGLLVRDLNSLSTFLSEDEVLSVEKINIGAIGNIVPRFHLHVVGRNQRDPAWPGPVWGHPDHEGYGEGDVENLSRRLASAVPDFSHVS